MKNKDLKKILEETAIKFTPEYLEQLSKDCYKNDRKYPENFSNWYRNIKNFR